MFTFNSYTAAVKARDEAAALLPVAPKALPVEAPKVAKVKALDYIDAILGRFVRVATPEQKDFARFLVCDDWVAGLEVEHYGPTFAELAIRLAALESSEVTTAPPASFVAAVVEAIGPVADLGPEGPVDLAAYLASFGDDSAEPAYTEAEMDRMALDAAEMDSVTGCGWSDLPWGAGYVEGWNARVVRQIAEAEAAIGAAKVAAPCCPADEVAPCMGCAAESFAADLLGAVGPEPIDCPTCGSDGTPCPDCNPCPSGDGCPACSEGLTPDMLAVDPIPPGRYTLAALVRASGAIFVRWDNAAGDLIRDTLTGLADRIAATGAKSVHEYERLDALDRTAELERAEAGGWKAGYDEALREVCP